MKDTKSTKLGILIRARSALCETFVTLVCFVVKISVSTLVAALPR